MANKKPKEADEREICQPVEEVVNPILGFTKCYCGCGKVSSIKSGKGHVFYTLACQSKVGE